MKRSILLVALFSLGLVFWSGCATTKGGCGCKQPCAAAQAPCKTPCKKGCKQPCKTPCKGAAENKDKTD